MAIYFQKILSILNSYLQFQQKYLIIFILFSIFKDLYIKKAKIIIKSIFTISYTIFEIRK